MYKLMYEAIMKKAFGFNQTIHEADEDYLQTNLNIENLKVETT